MSLALEDRLSLAVMDEELAEVNRSLTRKLLF
jgi:hypothetical protein